MPPPSVRGRDALDQERLGKARGVVLTTVETHLPIPFFLMQMGVIRFNFIPSAGAVLRDDVERF